MNTGYAIRYAEIAATPDAASINIMYGARESLSMAELALAIHKSNCEASRFALEKYIRSMSGLALKELTDLYLIGYDLIIINCLLKQMSNLKLENLCPGWVCFETEKFVSGLGLF